MRKVFELEDLDCAVCAAKMQDAVGKIEGVKEVTVSFIAQKMTLEYDEAREKEIFKAVKKTCKKVEPDCTILGM
ncbi:MAG: heavy-metal-associated domain-containing protein [Clostridia bacterium]|nr:heavy-metal-associated domain-containing protein [Clostridia bacterium]